MCARRRVRSGALRARARPDQQAALDLRVREAADGPRDPRLRHAGGPRLHAVPAVQLDRRRARLDQHAPRKAARASSPSFSATSSAANRSSWSTAARRSAPSPTSTTASMRSIKIIANTDGIATGKIYNIGNPANNFSVRELAAMMLELALSYPEYRETRRARRDRRDDGRRLLRRGLPGRAEPRAEDRQHAAPTWTGSPRCRWTRRSSASSTRIAARSPRRGGSSTSRACTSRPQDRRRHAARHARGRPQPRRRCCAGTASARRSCSALGPDHTGRAIKRVFRPGFFGKVRRTSVVQHYGMRTLLYGTLLPGPDIGRRAADVMRDVRDAGLRDRHPHVGSRALAGRSRRRRCGMDASGNMHRACERYTRYLRGRRR